ncbi:diacylglycerol kinase family protein [Sporolactobacillus kofuensis]|uniref:Diacylglycerol kinase family protein n=1 Tax=Sporolactobacillus kofuensis TaxID=269672 RepID=A0ABW1W918_9BACL|nr:diacylglycerol kinase family protein [Sporolactobacillus kofuensis]MCO7175687.1 diacylglycerol kinase family protein [Sporolactobacillus kofuensis]
MVHHPRRHKQLIESFKDAISGFVNAFIQERNLHIQIVAAIFVIVFSLIIHIHFVELLIVFVLIGGVISLELMNTAIERVVDLVTQEQHPMAKAAKDTAAAAVWWFSVISAVIYLFIVVGTLIGQS